MSYRIDTEGILKVSWLAQMIFNCKNK